MTYYIYINKTQSTTTLFNVLQLSIKCLTAQDSFNFKLFLDQNPSTERIMENFYRSQGVKYPTLEIDSVFVFFQMKSDRGNS